MKAISVRQPWAWLIVNGFKDVENRTWKTKHRGPILIHASREMDWGAFGSLPADILPKIPASKHLPRGGIVGSVELVACVVPGQYASEWFTGDYGFVLKNPTPYEPMIPMKGQLGIFSVELAQLRLMKLISTAQERAEGEDHGSTEKHSQHGGIVPDQEERGEEEGVAPPDP